MFNLFKSKNESSVQELKRIIANLEHYIEGVESERDEAVEELKKAKDLRGMFDDFGKEVYSFVSGSTCTVSMPDVSKEIESHFAIDYFTGKKIIKENANKVVILDPLGTPAYSHTLRKPDKGYDYKLVRIK